MRVDIEENRFERLMYECVLIETVNINVYTIPLSSLSNMHIHVAINIF